MNVISRNCIHKNIKLFQFKDFELDRTYDYTEFCGLIDKWKLLLRGKYNAQPGQLCLVDFTFISPTYFAALFAATELGLILVVDVPHCYNDEDVLSYKVNMHGKIDFVLTHEVKYSPDHVFYYEYDVKRNAHIGRNVVFQRELYEYVADPELTTSISDLILCKPADPVVYACSSGTTGTPKRIEDSHEKVFLMAERLTKHLGFEATDRILHTRNIHHGASMVYHFLPSFMCGGEQYTPGFTVDDLNLPGVQNLIKFVNENRLNQLFLYRPEFLHNFLSNCDRFDDPVKVQTLFQIGPDIIKLAKEKNLKWVKFTFGDTHIGLGLFIKTVLPDTDIDSYVVTNMGPPRDDFYQFDIRDFKLYISIPSIGQDWKTSNDKFEVVDGEYIFEGRSDQYKIGEDWINFAELESTVKQLFKGAANVTVDFEMQKLYLAVWKDNPAAELEFHQYLTETFSALRVAYVLRNENVKEYFNGRKIDLSRIRDRCRSKLGIKLEDTFLKGNSK